LVGGERFVVDGGLIKADASRQEGIEGDKDFSMPLCLSRSPRFVEIYAA
jgi:hypothetical protein